MIPFSSIKVTPPFLKDVLTLTTISPVGVADPTAYTARMNATLTDRKLNRAAWRRRYHAAFTTLLHFRLTVQALSLPDDPAPEQLPEAELDRFLRRLLADLSRFVGRETRFLEALDRNLRPWRVGELLPILDLFDETASLVLSVLPDGIRVEWRRVAGEFIRLKARVVQLHFFN